MAKSGRETIARGASRNIEKGKEMSEGFSKPWCELQVATRSRGKWQLTGGGNIALIVAV